MIDTDCSLIFDVEKVQKNYVLSFQIWHLRYSSP